MLRRETFRNMTKPDTTQEGHQRTVTLQLFGIAIGLACIFAIALARRYL
jgi:hypothetical protein